MFGAGTGNAALDTAAFQAAAAYFGSTPASAWAASLGGVLTIPAGVYNINAPVLFECSGGRVVGDGIESTKIYLATNLPANTALFTFKHTNTAYSNVGCSVEDIFIDM